MRTSRLLVLTIRFAYVANPRNTTQFSPEHLYFILLVQEHESDTNIHICCPPREPLGGGVPRSARVFLAFTSLGGVTRKRWVTRASLRIWRRASRLASLVACLLVWRRETSVLRVSWKTFPAVLGGRILRPCSFTTSGGANHQQAYHPTMRSSPFGPGASPSHRK